MNREKMNSITSAEDFKKAGYKVVDWLCDYMKGVEKFPVMAQTKPGEIKEKIPTSPPEGAESMEEIFRDFQNIVLPGITHWQHPSFFAYFPANTSPPSILAEFLTAGLAVNTMIWETSPAATELEERVMEWLRYMLGLPGDFKGVIQDTASVATVCALLCARERVTDFRVNEKGFSEAGKLRVYASDQAHSSVEKGAKIAGFGRENVILVESDDDFRMKPQALESNIGKDIASGYKPTCVVATVGTTSSTSIDPLSSIGKVCSKHNVWLHVDAAHAGTAAILPEKRNILDGVELVDSFVFNPHKWMMTNFDCSAFFVKDPGILRRVFEIHPEYLKTGKDQEVINYRDWGIQLGRRFRALKLWFVIRNYGVKGLQEIIRNHILWAQEFAKWVDESEVFERLAPVPVNLVCFRFNPGKKDKKLTEEELEFLNKRLIEEVNRSGKIYITHTKLKGKYSLRLCVGQATTQLKHVEEAWRILNNTRVVKQSK